MTTPNDLIKSLTKYNDIETATAIWAQANQITKQYEEVKKMCHAIVEKHLRETGEAKGKTATCSYGWTNPKPKTRLNESAWQKAIVEQKDLYELVSQHEWQKKRLEQAQKPYLEEYTPPARIYIK